jgi:AcrR family transcriptional regulator
MARPRQVSDEEILRVARRELVAHGPAVPTQAIADAVGLSQAALFKRFGTKRELILRALAPPERIAWVELARSGPDARPIRDQLVEILGAAEAFMRELWPALLVLKGAGVEPREVFARCETPPPLQALRAMEGFLARAMASGRMRALDPSAVATSLVGQLHARGMFHHVMGADPRQDGPTYVATIVDVAWRGLAPEGERE